MYKLAIFPCFLCPNFANAGVHTYLGFPIVEFCCIYHFFDFIVSHSLQFEAARAQAAANPSLRHIGGPLGPAQMMAMAQSREARQETDARTMALLQYHAGQYLAGQPPLPSGPMAVAGNYFSYKITYIQCPLDIATLDIAAGWL